MFVIAAFMMWSMTFVCYIVSAVMNNDLAWYMRTHWLWLHIGYYSQGCAKYGPKEIENTTSNSCHVCWLIRTRTFQSSNLFPAFVKNRNSLSKLLTKEVSNLSLCQSNPLSLVGSLPKTPPMRKAFPWRHYVHVSSKTCLATVLIRSIFSREKMHARVQFFQRKIERTNTVARHVLL